MSQGGKRYRRGMYIIFKRTVPYPMLMAFDAPDATVSCSRRERSNTPLQALTLLNDPEFHACAQALAEEVDRQHSGALEGAVSAVFLRCLGRRPRQQERTFLVSAYTDLLELSDSEGGSADEALQIALTAICRIVMNLDEFITRN